LGQTEEAHTYGELHARIAREFQRNYLDAATGKLKHSGSPQCANAMAIGAEVLPADRWPALIEDIIADLQKRDWQQTPGDIGHVYFIRALARAGRSDVLHRVYARTGKGSYGGVLAKGLTSMPETWDAMMDGYQSLNHCMLGHAMEWLYGYVAGIRQTPGSAGWREVVIGPVPGPLTSTRAALATPRGKITSDWRVKKGRFYLETRIPEGVTAFALMPSGREVPLRPGLNKLEEPAQH
jgi:hypothetical protein